jgi:hypothetical protein
MAFIGQYKEMKSVQILPGFVLFELAKQFGISTLVLVGPSFGVPGETLI